MTLVPATDATAARPIPRPERPARLRHVPPDTVDMNVPVAGLRLRGGTAPAGSTVRVRLTGSTGAPIVAVLGGISASRLVADAPDGKGWWRSQVGSGRSIDTALFRVLSFEWFVPTGAIFPVTPGDQARVLVEVMDALEIDTLERLIGASYGAMVGIQFAIDAPDRVRHLTAISGAHRPHPIATAWRSIQRRIVDLAEQAGNPEAGVSLARELAMTTYRTADEFASRFDGPSAGGRFPIEDYLAARGQDFADRFTARRFRCLSESIDLQDAEPEAGTVPAVFAGVCQDSLVPPAQMEELARRWSGPARVILFDSLYGHDAFLKADEAMAAILGALRGGHYEQA